MSERGMSVIAEPDRIPLQERRDHQQEQRNGGRVAQPSPHGPGALAPDRHQRDDSEDAQARGNDTDGQRQLQQRLRIAEDELILSPGAENGTIHTISSTMKASQA